MTTLAEDERLILEMKKKNNEIEKLRVGHTAKTPSIYIQNSHSEQTWDCLKVPKEAKLNQTEEKRTKEQKKQKK